MRSARFHLQLLCVAALLLGGGGVAYGLRNLAIQLLALGVLAAHPQRVAGFVRTAPWGLRALVLATLALPLLQLLPLPPALWQALPGRGAVAESFALAELGARWFPLSLDPMRTLVAFCGTLAPATIIILGSALPREDKLALAHTLLWGCVAAFALGAMQLLSGNAIGLLYAERPRADVFYATFANRNSTALLFVTALTLLAALPWPRHVLCRWAWGGAGALFAVAVVLTQSRSGMALLALPVLVLALRLILAKRMTGRPLAPIAALLLGAGVLGAGAMALTVSGESRLATSLDRFAGGASDRPEMWEDSVYAARFYAPVGSGMGTFDEVFQLHESLEHVSPRKAGRAHSDWLEIAIEGGVPALLIALGWLLWIARASLRGGSPQGTWLRLGAGAGLAAIALQSLLDYPLRNQTMLCMGAVLVVLLVRAREAER
ncbi:O-antigen ligase family protein [Erythrobacter sp. EC-HK427]|uniref:O-antigen ligase family protein n=1 Tax=Erythrobacter sp. EC-HK427 TaxID=2038396 RepID=UPI00125C6208|nr:O-antigen ligase family protein [Erythrobacter sp. EC-HK427]VVT02186.1 conserved membrane hypothetical protein [Erythrobacter sp. EC-HK427]